MNEEFHPSANGPKSSHKPFNPLMATGTSFSSKNVLRDDFAHFPDDPSSGFEPHPQKIHENGLKTLQIGFIMDAEASFFHGVKHQTVSQPEN